MLLLEDIAVDGEFSESPTTLVNFTTWLKIKCWFCNELAHRAEECRNRVKINKWQESKNVKEPNMYNSIKGQLIYFHCGESEHKRTNYKEYKKPNEKSGKRQKTNWKTFLSEINHIYYGLAAKREYIQILPLGAGTLIKVIPHHINLDLKDSISCSVKPARLTFCGYRGTDI